MYDIKFIRNNPEEFDAILARRFEKPMSAEILELDSKVRTQTTELQELQTKKNEIAKKIGNAKSKGEDASDFFKESDGIRDAMHQYQDRIDALQAELKDILIRLPNSPHDSVPIGEDEASNKFVRDHGTPRVFDFDPIDHHDLGEDLGLIDFKQTAHISGARFATLIGHMARLERALAAFMLDIHTKEFGYTEVSPPALVRDHAMFGVGQLPKFAEDSFQTTDGRRLIPTAEVSLTNLVADQIVQEVELPKRYTAYTQCFRSEAGSSGRDTKGMIRVHQFSKVELVSITRPQESEAEHERMTAAAEEVLKRLDLPYRVMLLSSGDMGFSAIKTYDLEVWIPTQKQYREISSVSNCADFQARRMNARYKDLSSKKNHFVHTLNGSGLAVGRTIVALMENYQNADKSITVPSVLVPYMNGIEKLGV